MSVALGIVPGSGELWAEPEGWASAKVPGQRRVELTPAAAIRMRAVRWLWHERLAQGTLALLAGREGLGKSTIAYWIVARVTRGELDGRARRRPRAVLIAATEDSWEHTIVPRLTAAGADLSLVYRVEVVTSEDTHSALSLPADNRQVEEAVRSTDAAMILLDPLMSRLDGSLDTHKDADVRRALEPLVSIADRTSAVVLGLIHLNKGGSGDLLTTVMGSRAFAAVARTVLAAIPGPEDDGTRLFGVVKSNLGRDDLPATSYRIESHPLVTDEGEAFTTSRVAWLDDASLSVSDAMRSGGDDYEERAAATEASRWLADYLEMQGGEAKSQDIKTEGRKVGLSPSSLDRARRRLRLDTRWSGFPAVTYWATPAKASEAEPERTEPAVFVRCRRCGLPLDDVEGTGLHPTCQEES